MRGNALQFISGILSGNPSTHLAPNASPVGARVLPGDMFGLIEA